MDIPGPLGGNAVEILEFLPNISELNGVSASKILETGKHVIDSMLLPRLPEWIAGEPLADRILSAMWQYLMSYRLADEEKIDETSVWYDLTLTCLTILVLVTVLSFFHHFKYIVLIHMNL